MLQVLSSQVCADPVNLDITVADPRQGIRWTHKFDGEASMYVPYLSIDIPDLGKAGVKVGVEVGGRRGQLDAFLTLSACVEIGGEEVTVATKRLRVPEHAPALPKSHTPPAVYGGEQAPEFEKCLPSHGMKVISGHFDFSWVKC